MQIDILSLFPSVFAGYLSDTPFWYAVQQDIARVRVHNFCLWVSGDQMVATLRKTRRGQTMVINPEPVAACIESIRSPDCDAKVVLLSPRGRSFDQDVARDFSRVDLVVV